MGSCQIDLEHRYLKNRLRVTRKMTHMASTLLQLTSLAVCGVGLLVLGQDLAEIPQDLSFSCEGRAYGYYADPSTNCQVFHICLGDGDIKWSFLCPNQTIFNQQYFVCDYAINVECNNAESFYNLNANFGQVTSNEDDSSIVEEA